jgi:hypothetical protein
MSSPTDGPRVHEPRGLVTRVDHVYARVERPQALFETLTERLGLPRSYGFTRVPILEGGAVSIGDLVFLEALRYAPRRRVTPPARPGLNGLALEVELPLAEAATELSARGLAHSPPYTFSGYPGPFAFAQPLQRAGLRSASGPLWSMVVVGGLLGEKRLARLRPLLPAHGDSLLARVGGRIAGGLMSNRRFGPFAVARSIGPHPTVWLHEFHVADMHVARRAAAEQLRACSGGKLGLQRVREIRLSATDLRAERERWQRLLDPRPRGDDGAWHFAEGPSLRLVEGDSDRIEALVCDVASLDAATDFLEREGILGAANQSEARLAPEALEGLEIRLAESAPVLSADDELGGEQASR